jgi:type IV pilus assembly protein PilO
MNASRIDWTISKAGSWPLSIKTVAMISCYGLVLSTGYYFDTLSQLTILDERKTSELTLKKDIAFKQTQLSQSPDIKAHALYLENQLSNLLKDLPSKEEMANLLIDISKTGTLNGLKFTLFKPEAPLSQDFYMEQPVTIKVIGQYQTLGHFISGLASLPRIVTLHDLTMTSLSVSGEILMTATVKTYYENTDQYKLAVPQLALSAQPQATTVIFNTKDLRNPFIPYMQDTFQLDKALKYHLQPDSTRPKELLEAFALTDLNMVGTITMNSMMWALIKTEENMIYRVKVGDYLGQHDGKITQINNQGLELNEIIPYETGLWQKQLTTLMLSK